MYNVKSTQDKSYVVLVVDMYIRDDLCLDDPLYKKSQGKLNSNNNMMLGINSSAFGTQLVCPEHARGDSKQSTFASSLNQWLWIKHSDLQMMTRQG